MRIMTWNINSLRLRLPLLQQIVMRDQPDILCLQETKVTDDLFPAESLTALGFEYQHFTGMKSYNGVAILSRTPFIRVLETPIWCEKSDCRHNAVEIGDASKPITIHNFYVPAGGDIPDPVENPKFAHKLRFLDEVTAWFAAHRPERAILVGDLNTAPLEQDVWSHKQLLNVVCHTEPEVRRHVAWQNTGFTDVMRVMVPADQKLYTWWSYRNRDWAASDRGRRLDHIWVSDDIAARFETMRVLRDIRGAAGPSDHVPVFADIAL
ncbi:exodeoxyribonuclease III [Sorlinia euscelidii]